MATPPQLHPPWLWLPSKGRVRVLLPYDASNRSANPTWIKDVLGSRTHVAKGEAGTWEVARQRADELLAAMSERFGEGTVTVITDAVQQRKCGESCQNGKPENALKCECQCGGANHGGVSDTWVIHGQFAIETTKVRRVFLV